MRLAARVLISPSDLVEFAIAIASRSRAASVFPLRFGGQIIAFVGTQDSFGAVTQRESAAECHSIVPRNTLDRAERRVFGVLEVRRIYAHHFLILCLRDRRLADAEA